MKSILVILLFLFLSPEIQFLVGAQPGSGGESPPRANLYPYTRVNPLLTVIIAGIATSFFFIVIFAIYLRHRSVSSVISPTAPRRSAAVISSGLDRSVLETFPTFPYSEVKSHKIGKGVLECAVCLSEFEDDETLRFIPKCDHVFHLECIDAWLESHVTCPVCRADLVPKPGDDKPVLITPTGLCENSEEIVNYIAERSGSRNDQVVIQINEENQHQSRRMGMNRNLSFQYPKRKLPQKLWSFQKFRSFSTGHLLVQPGEDMNRFTLRLPEVVRKEVIDRALLNRSSSIAIIIEDGGEGSTNNRTMKKSDREVKSDRWDFFTRALSMKLRSPRGVVRKIEESSGST